LKLFTAYSSAELAVVRATRQLVIRPVPGTAPPLGLVELLPTEDMRYWREVIEAQPDRERISDYDQAFVVAVEVPTEFVTDLVTSSEYGRVSAAVADMFTQLGRPGPAPVVHPMESEVFILNRIDFSVDEADGMTQHYLLRGGLTGTGSIMDAFTQQVQRIDVVGGVSGASESIPW
jgi:hypothetical protein